MNVHGNTTNIHEHIRKYMFFTCMFILKCCFHIAIEFLIVLVCSLMPQRKNMQNHCEIYLKKKVLEPNEKMQFWYLHHPALSNSLHR